MRAAARVSVRLGIVFTVVAMTFATLFASAPPTGAAPAGPPTDGFVLLGGDGGIFPFNVPFAGSSAGLSQCQDNVIDRGFANGTCWSVALTPSGLGYWILDVDTGEIHAFGTAGFYGHPASKFAVLPREFVPLSLQIVPTPSGRGYWVYEVGQSDLGMVDHFGDAAFYGSTTTLVQQNGGLGFNGAAVGMAATATGKGYWEVRSDGGVFAFGDAKFYGSTGAIHLAQPIIGITATASGKGYWLYAADGGVFSFGDAVFGGSLGALHLNKPIVGMARNPVGPGYWLAAADGGIFAFGGAPWLGSLPGVGVVPHRPIFAIASKNGLPG